MFLFRTMDYEELLDDQNIKAFEDTMSAFD